MARQDCSMGAVSWRRLHHPILDSVWKRAQSCHWFWPTQWIPWKCIPSDFFHPKDDQTGMFQPFHRYLVTRWLSQQPMKSHPCYFHCSVGLSGLGVEIFLYCRSHRSSLLDVPCWYHLEHYFVWAVMKQISWLAPDAGSLAPQCAGCIHGDMERGFIKAEVCISARFACLWFI